MGSCSLSLGQGDENVVCSLVIWTREIWAGQVFSPGSLQSAIVWHACVSCLHICVDYKSLHIPPDKTYKLEENMKWDWEPLSWNWKYKKHNFSSLLIPIDIARFAKTKRGPCHFTTLQNLFTWAVSHAMTGSHSALQWKHRPAILGVAYLEMGRVKLKMFLKCHHCSVTLGDMFIHSLSPRTPGVVLRKSDSAF